MRAGRLHFWANLVLLLLIVAFLFSYFEPRLLFSQTTTTGGDTASHFATAVFYSSLLLQHFQITGWDYGNFAGYPLFHYYFPLPFILCALLSLAVPITISFKIVTALGVFLLPFAVFYFLRKLEFCFPVPVLGAFSTLPFLFVESQSIWGGNISSALSGEFAYSHGLALLLVYLASFYSGIRTKSNAWRNALLLALAGLSHGCALLVAGFTPLACLFQDSDTYPRVKYYLKVNSLAFLLLAFWLVPWMASREYMSVHSFSWIFRSMSELFPPVLLPLYVLAAISGVWTLYRLCFRMELDGRLLYLWFAVLVSIVLFGLGHPLNVVPVRFIPFVQLFLCLIGIASLERLLQRMPLQWLVAAAVASLTLVWTDSNSGTIRGWIAWNYQGWEAKPAWPVLREAASFLRGTMEQPRVAWEFSPQNDEFGSSRVFESLPYFSGRSTLEGLYLESSLNAPLIFYLQSEISEVSSCPLPDYYCSFLDLERALPHLRLFNTSHMILRSDAAKREARSRPGLVLEKAVPPLEIYRIAGNSGSYVSPLPCRPVLYTGSRWKREVFQWYLHYSPSSVPVVIDRDPARQDMGQFTRATEHFPVAEECSPQPRPCLVEEKIEYGRIRIRTDCIGQPLLLKMSYHPRWKVKGASKVYLAAPGFMLVFPRQKELELSFGWAASNYLGVLLTSLVLFLGALGCRVEKILRPRRLVIRPWSLPVRLPPVAKYFHSSAGSRFLKISLALLILAAVGLAVSAAGRRDSNVLFNMGQQYYSRDNLDLARWYFQRAAESNPESSVGIYARLFWGLCLYRQKDYREAVNVFQGLVRRFPRSIHAAEAMYHIAWSLKQSGLRNYQEYFHQTMRNYPASRWAQLSSQHLSFDLGARHFDLKEYEKARSYFRQGAVDQSAASEHRALCQYYVALCDFRRGRWRMALEEFQKLLTGYPDSKLNGEAGYYAGICYEHLGEKKLAAGMYREVLDNFPGTAWAESARQRLK